VSHARAQGQSFSPVFSEELRSLFSSGCDLFKIVKSMTKLLKKNKPFKWVTECQASFKELKKYLTSTRSDQEVRHIL
jgi:hypothetical protein